eukprot:TRINITY_DN3351_c0_g1_i2.p2 TRINITY_DN3351_c0_g1~~TRINITY_DN3351_c0_g1_i2.p2  ORF type:complete len:122 (-),score=45.87 TRINITY_DN3351_c0_g1_i2:205-570(-)
MLTESDRIKLRGLRFKLGSETTTLDTLNVLVEEEGKKKKRFERFGTSDPGEEQGKMKKRAARFNLPTDESERQRLEQRSKRFGSAPQVIEDEKVKKRNERFNPLSVLDTFGEDPVKKVKLS